MRAVVALAVLGSGCDLVIGLDRPTEPPQTELPAFCGDPEVFDDFATGIACPWGVTTETSGGSVERRESVLAVTVSGERAMYAGCTAFRAYPFTERGVFLKVAQPLHVATSYTVFKLRGQDGAGTELGLSFDGDLELFVDGMSRGSLAGEPPTWWRLRRAGSRAVAEVSADAVAWTTVADVAVPLPTTVAIDIGAGINGASQADTATFEAFGACR